MLLEDTALLPSNLCLSSPPYTFTLPFHFLFLLPPFHSPSCLITLLFLSFCLSPTFPSLSVPSSSSLMSVTFSLFIFPQHSPLSNLPHPLTILISPLPCSLNLYHCLPLSPHIIHLLCLSPFHISSLFTLSSLVPWMAIEHLDQILHS